MKNIYTNPMVDIIKFESRDLITASENSSGDGISIAAIYKGDGIGGGFGDTVEY